MSFGIITIIAFLSLVPAIISMARFSSKDHKKALSKALFIWFFSLLPPLVLVIFKVSKNTDVKLEEFFGYQELFIYSASFLAPVLYIIHENEWNNHKFFWKPYTLSIFPYAILFATSIGYAFYMVEPPLKELPIYIPLYIYTMVLILWYLSHLDGVIEPDKAYRDSLNYDSKKLTKRLTEKLDRRIR